MPTGLDVCQSSDAQNWPACCSPRETPLRATHLRHSIGADGRNLRVSSSILVAGITLMTASRKRDTTLAHPPKFTHLRPRD